MISSGHDCVDRALGGGFHRGITVIYGPPGAGKSGLALSACGQAQQPAWVDMDSTLDKRLAEKFNLPGRMMVVDGSSGNEHHIIQVINSSAGAFDLLVVDPMFSICAAAVRELVSAVHVLASVYGIPVIMIDGDHPQPPFSARSSAAIEFGAMKETEDGGLVSFRTIKNANYPPLQYGEYEFSW